MVEVGQGEIKDPHCIEGIHAPQDDFNDDNEVIIGVNGPPNDAKEGEDYGISKSDNGHNDPVHGD